MKVHIEAPTLTALQLEYGEMINVSQCRNDLINELLLAHCRMNREARALVEQHKIVKIRPDFP